MGQACRISRRAESFWALEEVTIRLPIDRWKIVSTIACIATAIVIAYYAQPGYHDNQNAVQVVATVFSVLAGFLVNVMVLSSDEKALRGSNIRQDKVHLNLLRRDLQRHRNMFILCLVVLMCAFAASLTKAPQQPPEYWRLWMERAVIFFGALAIFWSFRLPGYLMRRHLDLLNRRLNERHDTANQLPPTHAPER